MKDNLENLIYEIKNQKFLKYHNINLKKKNI
jgi:hypothetical protein